jgi:hypothetical protein
MLAETVMRSQVTAVMANRIAMEAAAARLQVSEPPTSMEMAARGGTLAAATVRLATFFWGQTVVGDQGAAFGGGGGPLILSAQNTYSGGTTICGTTGVNPSCGVSAGPSFPSTTPC